MRTGPGQREATGSDGGDKADGTTPSVDDRSDIKEKMTTANILAGITCLQRGLAVFPIAISWNEKKGKTDKRPLTNHGYTDATTDKAAFFALVEAGAKKLKDGEVLACATVPGSGGFVVFDGDVDNGKKGAEFLADTLKLPPWTYTPATASGGVHRWYRKPDTVATISNKSPWARNGVDIRADNGYVVCPGTVTQWGDWTDPAEPGWGSFAQVPERVWDQLCTPAPAPTVSDATVEPVEVEVGFEVPVEVAEKVADLDPDTIKDRSVRFHHLVGECYRANLTQAQTVTVLTPWCAKVGKYVGRVAEQVAGSWVKVKSVEDWEAGIAAGDTASGSDLPDGDTADQHNSWQRQAVDAILDGTYVPEVATLLPRDDGVGLFYRGRTHSIHAESESGKSMLVQYEAARLLNAGEAVAYLDFESDAASVVRRLLDLGAKPEAIRQRFDYRRPEVAPAAGTDEGTEWGGLLRADYALVVVDGVTEAMDILAPKSPGGDLNERIASFLRRYPGRIAEHTGAAVVLIDHVVKNTENRGRHAYGGQHKMNGLTGAAYTVEVKTQPRRGHIGELHLFVAKDRPAGIRPHCGPVRPDRTQLAAVVTIDSTGEQMKMTVSAPGVESDTGPTTFRPTALMERVSRWLEAHPGEHSRNRIAEEVPGNKTYKLQALDVLATEGYATVTEQPRGSMTQRNYAHNRLFTEVGDAPEPAQKPKPVQPVPNRSQTGPGTDTPQTGPTGPSPLLGGPVDGTGIGLVPEHEQTTQTGPGTAGADVVQNDAEIIDVYDSVEQAKLYEALDILHEMNPDVDGRGEPIRATAERLDGTPAVCPGCGQPHGLAPGDYCYKCFLAGGGL